MRCYPNGEPAAVVPRLWPDSTLVILASGPSLTPDDVTACRGRAPVIAINDTHRLAPWADVLYSSDQHWWAHYKGVPTFAGRKYGIWPLRPYREWAVEVLANTGDRGLERNPSGLRTGKNSGAAAVNLAVHLGARRIVLLGFDMGRTGGKAHFFGEHPAKLRAATPFPFFIAAFETMVKPLQAIGVEVINASRQTALTCFPRVTLDEALA